MDEARLIHKLGAIEALFAGAATEGEKNAAERAKERILERLNRWKEADPPVEYRFTMGDMWSRKVFVALLRRYDIRPYRYHGQRYTTVMAIVSKGFVDEVLWPEFKAISETLHSYLSDITDRIVHQVIHQDNSEAEVVEKPAQLAYAGAASNGATAAARTGADTERDPNDSPTDPQTNGDLRRKDKNKRKKKKKRNRRR